MLNALSSIFSYLTSCLNLYDFNIDFGDMTINFKSVVIFIFLLNLVLLILKLYLRKDDKK